MKKIDSQSLVVVLMGLILVCFFTFSSGWRVDALEEARVGSSVSRVLLHWKLMVIEEENRLSYIRNTGLDSSLGTLKKALKGIDSPSFLTDRVTPLQAKLERAKTDDVWPFQFGLWHFAEEDPTVSLSGVEKDEDILVEKSGEDESRSKRLGFRYLKFSGDKEEALVSVGELELLRTPMTESFTLEFWVRLREVSGGRIVTSDNWNLELDENIPVLNNFSGDLILAGQKIPRNYWTHLALIRDGEKIELYQNGNEVDESSYRGPLKVSEEIVFGGGLIGDVDELRIKDRSVNPEYLNFDRPIDYLIGFPVLGWVQNEFGPEELWHFYAGLLVSNLSIKRDSDNYSVSIKDVNRAAEFLLSEDEEKLKLPPALPDSVLGAIEKAKELEDGGELSNEEKEEIGEFLESLTNYLDLD
ncbi:LamG domain-containing protein [Candidatus Bipolaricaulota bacterium]|nr:LamG domain-containing protein [Candidatus Bipolaricaulota bacterium]